MIEIVVGLLLLILLAVLFPNFTRLIVILAVLLVGGLLAMGLVLPP